jgi:hypothetical protein
MKFVAQILDFYSLKGFSKATQWLLQLVVIGCSCWLLIWLLE